MKQFLWSKVGVHYRADKKYKKCLGKLCFKGHLQADSFLVELILILLSHIGQRDSLRTCELGYMLFFNFTSKPLQLDHNNIIVIA